MSNCTHRYSKSMDEPRPRLCVLCQEPEYCHACNGVGNFHMCCPACTSRDMGRNNHTCVEHKPKKTVFVSPGICGHGWDDIKSCIKCTPLQEELKPILTKWDNRFMEQANFVASWSKDKNTKCGAVIVDDENTELVMGYNGFPRGADDNTDQRRYEKPEKYVWTEHAERNAIYKAARLGISLKNTKMYCTYFPCVDCARAIIQAGIIKLYTNKPDLNHEKWGDSWLNAIIMFKECGVELIWTNEI